MWDYNPNGLTQLGYTLTPKYYDNEVVVLIFGYPTFPNWTKHIKIDCYFVFDEVLQLAKFMPQISSFSELGDIFKKSLSSIWKVPNWACLT